MIKIKKRQLFFFFLILLSVTVPLVFAKALEIHYPTFGGITPITECGFPQYALYVFKMIISLSGLIVFAVLVWSGFNYLMSGDDTNRRVEAKNKAMNAFRGLMILLISYIFLNLINPQLTIFKLPCESATSSSGGVTPSSSTQTITFQEIPVGSAVERSLGRNISCFDKDRNPIDCQSKDKIGSAMAKEKEISPDAPFYYCYQYDTDGNRSGLLENQDRWVCVEKLAVAAKAKIDKLKSLGDELYILTQSCKCSLCERGTCKPGSGCCCPCMGKDCGHSSSCDNSSCTSNCHCCGGPRGETTSCSGNGPYVIGNDPCPNRSEIDSKREQINQIIHGGDAKDIGYDPSMDPNKNPDFLTIEFGLKILTAFKDDIEKDYNNLQEVEAMMKSPYGKRLTLAEFEDLKRKNTASIFSFEKTNFKDYNIANYFNNFNCTKLDSNGECISCNFDKEKKQSLGDGDGATFYFNDAYKEETILTQEKCTVEPSKEAGYAQGLIPIGEVVDETEAFHKSIIDIFNNLILEIPKAISEGDVLRGLPESCTCTNCGNSMATHYSRCGGTSDFPCTRCSSCTCTVCSGTICPYSTMKDKIDSINSINSNVNNYSQRLINLARAQNLSSSDENRCRILNKLNNVRQKLDRCITGWEVPTKETAAPMRTFSCQSGLDLVYLSKLVVLPDFPYPAATDYLNCYPFNSSILTTAQKQECLKNKDSQKCQSYIKDLLDNYYCCEGVIR